VVTFPNIDDEARKGGFDFGKFRSFFAGKIPEPSGKKIRQSLGLIMD
jgi:hypothetical protein